MTSLSGPGLPKHRVEALCDGIFAVAMTLLVIDLRVPDRSLVHSPADLLTAVGHLASNFVAWVVSFFVLAVFWVSHHRLFHRLRGVDGALVWWTVAYLGMVSLVPFSSSLVGEYGEVFFAQCVYSTNIGLLALASFLTLRHVNTHPELCAEPLPAGAYRAARFRAIGAMAAALAAIGLESVLPGVGSVAFVLMLPVSWRSRRLERT